MTGERFAPRRVKGGRAARDRGGTLIAWLAAYGGSGAGRAGCRRRCRSRWRELAPVRVPRAPLRSLAGLDSSCAFCCDTSLVDDLSQCVGDEVRASAARPAARRR